MYRLLHEPEVKEVLELALAMWKEEGEVEEDTDYYFAVRDEHMVCFEYGQYKGVDKWRGFIYALYYDGMEPKARFAALQGHADVLPPPEAVIQSEATAGCQCVGQRRHDEQS